MYEEHLTVKTNNINQFIADCSKIGCNPIIIQLQIDGENTEQQVMTSWKSRENYHIGIQSFIKPLLEDLQYTIVREKIEVHPDFYKVDSLPFIYYESHIRVALTEDREEMLSAVCKTYDFKMSKNILKQVSKTVYYKMLTFRTYSKDLEYFKTKIRQFSNILDRREIQYDKIELECCVKDTNTFIDKNWIS